MKTEHKANGSKQRHMQSEQSMTSPWTKMYQESMGQRSADAQQAYHYDATDAAQQPTHDALSDSYDLR